MFFLLTIFIKFCEADWSLTSASCKTFWRSTQRRRGKISFCLAVSYDFLCSCLNRTPSEPTKLSLCSLLWKSIYFHTKFFFLSPVPSVNPSSITMQLLYLFIKLSVHFWDAGSFLYRCSVPLPYILPQPYELVKTSIPFTSSIAQW